MSKKLRIQWEDALKHLFECEYRDISPTGESLAGALEVSLDQGNQLIELLKRKELISFEAGGFYLTESGRQYAMRMVRAHRLLETQLAIETGIHEREWHLVADKEEHKLSDEQLDALAKRLGDPRFDPHGDPIPTELGDIPRKHGLLLTGCPVGWEGEVLHIEDEPQKVYEQILAIGVVPGLRIRITEINQVGVHFSAEGRDLSVPANVAANISVRAAQHLREFDESVERLSGLSIGDKASIVGLLPSCRGAERNRLLDLGVVPGSQVEADFTSLSGSPVAYRIRGSLIALRREQADKILIRRDD